MVDQSVGPQSQGAVHKKLHMVHRHGSQWEKDSGHDPTADIHPDLDPTVYVCCQFIRGVFAWSNDRNFIHQAIQQLRAFPTLNRRPEELIDSPNLIWTQIGWSESNPTLIRSKRLIFGLIWAVQSRSDGQKYF